MNRCDEAVALSDPKQKREKYNEILEELIASSDLDSLQYYLQHSTPTAHQHFFRHFHLICSLVLSDAVPLVVTRSLLFVFAERIPHLAHSQHKQIAQFALEKLHPRVVSFGEQCAIIREQLAELCEKDEEWTEAARVLSGIDFESGMRQLDEQYKLGKYIKIAMLYLEDADHVNAEVYIKRSSSLIGNCRDDGLQLQYKMCYARVLDAKRRFLEVAMRYYELSSLEKMEYSGKRVREEELEMALLASVKCTILASAGPQRSRMLATLYKDERTAKLPVFPFLEKVFKERILQRGEVENFASTLASHQLARLPDGSTVLDRAVLQHNILSASKLYLNSSIEQLATLLGVDPEKAERAAADMISEGRLRGSIDQVKGFIYFDAEVNHLEQWDKQIHNTCQSVNRIMEMLEKKELQIEAATLTHPNAAGPST